MGQKVHPNGMRLGIVKDFNAKWFADKTDYAKFLLQDLKVREFLEKKLKNAAVSNITIERPAQNINVIIHTARPVIGKGGQEVDKLKEELRKLTNKEVQLNIFEIKRPELDAYLVASSVARQIENRISYKRAIKMAIQATMRMNSEGIKIQISGRLNGAEMARSEHYKEGRVPLHTLRADIDYGTAEANTTYGIIGVKVWIFKGEVFDAVLGGEEAVKSPAKKDRTKN